jgi:hypothetical protein
MGFLDSLFDGMVEAGVKVTEDKYRQMSLTELETEWKSVYAHKGFPANPNSDLELEVSSISQDGILDRIYAERTGKTSWRQKALERQRQHQQEEYKKQQNEIKKKKEQENKKKREEKDRSEISSFKKRLATSDMAKIIIDKIDSLGEEAKYVAVFPDRVVVDSDDYFLESFVYDDDDGLNELDAYHYLCEIKYKKYKYPSLNRNQCIGLRMYIEENAKVKFHFINNKKRYKHKDYPGCLKLAEDDEGLKNSW